MPQPNVLTPCTDLRLHDQEFSDDSGPGESPIIACDSILMRQVPGSFRTDLYLALRSCLDPVLAFLLLIAALPLILLGAALVKLTSRGPAFYSQTRVGRNGKTFRIHKLRTMVYNCESLTGPRWAIPGDPRITPLGHILRMTHIDEFPQLWNVVCGEMSLVGPRPERPEFVQQLEWAIPAYTYRLLVQPGITGLAQVQLPADSSLRSVKRKLLCDLFYIERMDPWLDLRILVCTALKFFGVPFTFSDRLLHLPRYSWIEQQHWTDRPSSRPVSTARAA